MTRSIILLTGATGFVGRQVLRCLIAEGRAVRVVVRAGSVSKLECMDRLESVVTTRDLFAETTEWWSRTCKNVETVIHLAWYAEPGLYLQAPQNFDCVKGTIDLVKGAISSNVSRFIGIGTCFEYDLRFAYMDIFTPLNPTTAYAISKASIFYLLSNWLPANKIAFAWCRLFYLFGEGEDARRLVAYIHERMRQGQPVELTSGIQIRDFMDVKTAAQAICDVSSSDLIGPVNVCSGIPVSVRQMAEAIAETYGRKDLLRFGARANNLADPLCVVGKQARVVKGSARRIV